MVASAGCVVCDVSSLESDTDMTLPCGVEELRETLNLLVVLEQENEDYRKEAVKDAKEISGLRRVIERHLNEIRMLTGIVRTSIAYRDVLDSGSPTWAEKENAKRRWKSSMDGMP